MGSLEETPPSCEDPREPTIYFIGLGSDRYDKTFIFQGAECGVGVARRNVTCERSGSNVDTSKESTEHCLSTLFESMKPTTLLSTISDPLSMSKMVDASEVDSCFKSCPPDCVLSDWTAW